MVALLIRINDLANIHKEFEELKNKCCTEEVLKQEDLIDRAKKLFQDNLEIIEG